MRRRYKRGLYAERVAKIKDLMPHACIGVDIIVGFPGETDEDFRESYRFIQELEVDYIHAFTYSERANTLAAEMEGVVPMHVRRERNKMLRILSDKKRRAHRERHRGQIREVLVENKGENGMLSGYTDNYIRVIVASNTAKVGEIVSYENCK